MVFHICFVFVSAIQQAPSDKMESLEHSGTSVDTSTEQETNLIEQPKTDMKEPDDDHGKIHVDEQPLTSDPGKDVDENL